MTFPITLTPITRYSMTLEREAEAGGTLLDNDKILQDFIARRGEAESKRDKVFGSFFLFDALLVLALTGSNINIPWLDMSTGSVPAIIEILVLISSISLFFSVAAFHNVSVYDNIINAFAHRRSANGLTDSDFLVSSFYSYDFYGKSFRPEFHVSGEDFYKHKNRFSLITGILNFMTGLIFLSIPILHFSIVGYTLASVFSANGITPIYTAFYVSVILLSAASILMAVLPWIGFAFDAAFDPREIIEARARKMRGQ